MAAGRAMRSSSKGTVALLNAQGGRMPEQSNDYRVAVFGAGGVGKSSIVLRFVKGTFQDSYIPTIEDTYRQVISCNKNNVCTLQITDTTGSHQFPAMQRLSIAKGHAFVLVYSITSRQSLEELKPIVDMIREVKGDEAGEVPVVLAANKVDEDSHREVSRELGQTLAKKWGCGFVETSAKTDANIKELFQQLLTLERRRNLNLNMEESGKKAGSKGGAAGNGSGNGNGTPASADSKKSGAKKGGAKCSLM